MTAVSSIIKNALLETSGGNLETFSILWLDATVNESEENIQIQEKLREIIHCVKIFDKLKEFCGNLGQILVPCVYHYRQISSIYVFCMNKERNDEWAQALRTRNIHLLYLYRFFMNDIYQQLHKHQYRTAVRVYRGQFMTNDEWNVFKDSIGQMLSMNSFLSTSLNRDIALEFIEANQSTNKDLQKVLFKIDADPSYDTTKPFANIAQQSEHADED